MLDLVDMSALPELTSWTELMSRGTANAMSGLSKMLGHEVKITSFELRPFSPEDACDVVGGLETKMVGVYLGIQEETRGHIVLLYPPRVAFSLVDVLIGNDPGTTREIRELEASALSEVGNIVGSYFLNSIADDTGVRLLPTTPQVKVDMAGAIISVALEDILGLQYKDNMFVIETAFDTSDKLVRGVLIILPSTDFLRAVKSPANQCLPE